MDYIGFREARGREAPAQFWAIEFKVCVGEKGLGGKTTRRTL